MNELRQAIVKSSPFSKQESNSKLYKDQLRTPPKSRQQVQYNSTHELHNHYEVPLPPTLNSNNHTPFNIDSSRINYSSTDIISKIPLNQNSPLDSGAKDPIFFDDDDDDEIQNPSGILIPPLEISRSSIEQILCQETTMQCLQNNHFKQAAQLLPTQGYCKCDSNATLHTKRSKQKAVEYNKTPQQSNEQSLDSLQRTGRNDSININLIGGSMTDQNAQCSQFKNGPQIQITLPAGMFYNGAPPTIAPLPPNVNNQQHDKMQHCESTNSPSCVNCKCNNKQFDSKTSICDTVGTEQSVASNGIYNYLTDRSVTNSSNTQESTSITTSRSDMFGEVILDRHLDPIACQHFFRTRLSKTKFVRKETSPNECKSVHSMFNTAGIYSSNSELIDKLDVVKNVGQNGNISDISASSVINASAIQNSDNDQLQSKVNLKKNLDYLAVSPASVSPVVAPLENADLEKLLLRSAQVRNQEVVYDKILRKATSDNLSNISDRNNSSIFDQTLPNEAKNISFSNDSLEKNCVKSVDKLADSDESSEINVVSEVMTAVERLKKARLQSTKDLSTDGLSRKMVILRREIVSTILYSVSLFSKCLVIYYERPRCTNRAINILNCII